MTATSAATLAAFFLRGVSAIAAADLPTFRDALITERNNAYSAAHNADRTIEATGEEYLREFSRKVKPHLDIVTRIDALLSEVEAQIAAKAAA